MAKKRNALGRGLDSLIGTPADYGLGTGSPQGESAAKQEEAAAKQAKVAEAPQAAKETETPKRSLSDDIIDPENPVKPKPYIEEDDHVQIRGVVSREAKRQREDEADIDDVVPNPDQPRTFFKKEEIEELAASIDREGLLQPILVRKIGDKYQIIAGERRWQACKLLNWGRVPIRVKEASDDKVIELALVENTQRSDLNPIEEAYGYKRMMERQGLTQNEVAQAVCKGRSTIANTLRLLELPERAQQLLYEEKITAGHARAILSVQSQEGREKLTQKLMEEQVSVREAENLARLLNGQESASTARAKKEPLPPYFKKVARSLRESLETNVRIKQVKGKNKVEIEFTDEEDLRRLLEKLSR